VNIPDWYELVLLALGAYRTWRLLAEDSIFDWPRRKVLRWGSWRQEGDPIPLKYREKATELLMCPACSGFWISLAWYVVWVIFPYETLIAASAAAISALLIFQRNLLDPPEE
jgi:Protein of unknown function (DUF1360)